MVTRFLILAAGLAGLGVAHAATRAAVPAAEAPASVRLKDLGRFLGSRDNLLVGYGIVTGLSGSGDTPRNAASRQAMANLLSQFDLTLPPDDIQSRNVAMVMVTATLPPSASIGDHLDINVTSSGDARSLSGGTLVMAELKGPDRQVYALAQGPITVGGYRFDANGNLRQKNHPTTGTVSGGAIVEIPVKPNLLGRDGYLHFVLKDADATTADRIAREINQGMGTHIADAQDAQMVRIRSLDGDRDTNALVARIEGLAVVPDQVSRIVINERNGTVTAGGDLRISPVAISHGDIRVAVDTEYTASQPELIGRAGPGIRSVVIGNSDMRVDEPGQQVAGTFRQTTVGELVLALSKSNVSTRDVIAILQSIKAAGALHADIVVQ
jgi:flagellar P-ring protein FlgI